MKLANLISNSKTVILVLTLLLLSNLAYCQNDLKGVKSVWNISEKTDLSSGETVMQHTVVVIEDRRITWGATASDGDPMSVTGSSGKWDAASQTGKVVYTIQVGSDSGTVTVEGTREGMQVLLDIVFSNGSAKLKLEVAKMSIQNQ